MELIQVICRIGSLEMLLFNHVLSIFCYLPYRQLRKEQAIKFYIEECYLPYRQLRNAYPNSDNSK